MTTKSTSRCGKHCYYWKCDGKLQTGKNWHRHLEKVHQIEDRPQKNMFFVCTGIDTCEGCIKRKHSPFTLILLLLPLCCSFYPCAAPFTPYTASFYPYTASFYPYTASFYPYTASFYPYTSFYPSASFYPYSASLLPL
jgi:hypothetical protein